MIDYIDTIRTTLKKRRKDNKIMASKVYFADLRADYHENLQQKLPRPVLPHYLPHMHSMEL